MTLLKFPLTLRKAIARNKPIPILPDSVFSFKIVTTTANQVITPQIDTTKIVSITWGDLNSPTDNTSYTYTTAGTYTITITYKQGTPFLNSSIPTHARKFLTEVVTITNVTNMSYMFFEAIKFNQDISGWDTSKVTNMSYMFKGATLFNKPINTIPVSKTNKVAKWNTSNVTNMTEMFRQALVFNQDISKWNVSKVTDMIRMFKESGIVKTVDNAKYLSLYNKSLSLNQDLFA